MTRTALFASLRFVMIFYIVQGHFLQVATKNNFWLALFKQHNAVVGCFFLLSGFLLALGQKSDQPCAFWPFIKKRLQRIYPIYSAVLLVFLPMFLAVDVHYGTTVLLEIKRAIICLLLIQAWHPDWGLLWNSPTWFLSSLVFCYACFPLIIARLNKLKKAMIYSLCAALFAVLVIIKILYCLKNGFYFLEGMVEPKPIPYFNFMRFFPPINLLEFILGMLFGVLARQGDKVNSVAKTFAPSLLLAGIVLLMFVRVYLPINDMLARTLFFTPLFLSFLYLASFGNARYLSIFASKTSMFLGEISFSLYVVHGALGQLFYKKAVVAMLGMPHVPYVIFLAILLVTSIAIYFGIERRCFKTMVPVALSRSS